MSYVIALGMLYGRALHRVSSVVFPPGSELPWFVWSGGCYDALPTNWINSVLLFDSASYSKLKHVYFSHIEKVWRGESWKPSSVIIDLECCNYLQNGKRTLFWLSPSQEVEPLVRKRKQACWLPGIWRLHVAHSIINYLSGPFSAESFLHMKNSIPSSPCPFHSTERRHFCSFSLSEFISLKCL